MAQRCGLHRYPRHGQAGEPRPDRNVGAGTRCRELRRFGYHRGMETIQVEGVGVRHHRVVVVSAIGITQTLAWASTYYIPAVFADTISAELHLSHAWFFGVFSAALLLSGILGPWAGRTIDRRGGRDVLAATNLV